MRYVRLLGLFLTLALISACAPPTAAPPAGPGASLYDRLGGYNAIAAVTDDFLDRVGKDPTFARFFGKATPEQLHVLRQHLVEQLCQAAGGPCFYTGRSMRAVHTGMHITEAEWSAFAADLNATLDKFHVGPTERQQLIAFVVSEKPDIVGI
jgi:hemoglobin